MKTKLVLHECKNYEITEENPRDFKIGDMFYFSWHGMNDIQEITDERILAEVNGGVKENPDSIDLVFNFWRSVRKVIKH